PETLATLEDVANVEKIPFEERFPCHSLFEAIETVCEVQGDATALTFLPSKDLLTDEPRRWTYRQYKEEVIAAANLFHSLGLESEQSVAFLCPNVPEMLFGMWGAQVASIACPMNPDLKPAHIAGICKEADARLMVTWIEEEDVSYLDKAISIQRENPSIEHIIVIGERSVYDDYRESNGIDGEELLYWADAVAAQNRQQLNTSRVIKGEDVASYFHTGGTTGAPKLAKHTHRAGIVNVCMMVVTGPGPGEDGEWPDSIILSALPLFHTNAVYVSTLTTIMGGGELILAGERGYRNLSLFEHFWALVERYKVTFFSTVPTVYAALLSLDSSSYDLSSLMFCSSGSAPISRNLLKEFKDRTGADVFEGYGMTELTGTATSHYFHGSRPIGSVGMRLPYHQLRTVILDSEGNIVRDCECNEIGAILHSGPTVMPGYKPETAGLDAWVEPDWFNSGDMGRIDEEGQLWLTGRVKDLIIRGGHNIDPAIPEESVSMHPEVENAAAVGKPDGYSGEVPIVYVQLVEGATVSAEELLEYAREHCTERAAAPKEVIVLNELPLTAVGKVFKPDLRKDAIARAYCEAAEEAFPDHRFVAEAVEDQAHGLCVVLGVITGVDDEGDLEGVEQRIADPLNEFVYPWKLIGQP
ncbi:MAG: acyl-CoA synthetase, partial [Pontiella sp.]|nr:acyl-CoA synthetase [Pontiella sp.]